MQGYQCWFYDQTIETVDSSAVMMVVKNLWTSNDDDPAQAIAAHSQCARERLRGDQFEIDPDVFRDGY